MKSIVFFYLFAILGCKQNKNITTNCDKNSVISIAEKQWLVQYGKKIYKRKPFITAMKNDTIWIVKGTLPKGYDGGVPYAEINARTCEILKISHGK